MNDVYTPLESETRGAVLLLTLNRPQSRNALDLALTRALAAELLRFESDAALRVLVLTGRDPAFCAGLDFKHFEDPASPRAEVGALLLRLPGVVKPVIGAINGAAMTGGLELALGCDFLIASERARFGDTHTRIGAVAGGGTHSRLPHTIGFRWAKQLSFTAQPIDAATALRIGLVNEVVPHEQLLPRALELAGLIAGHDPELVCTVKRVLDRGAETTLADSLALEAQALAERRASGKLHWRPK